MADELKQRILALHEQGLGYAAIGHTLGVARWTARHVILQATSPLYRATKSAYKVSWADRKKPTPQQRKVWRLRQAARAEAAERGLAKEVVYARWGVL